MDWAVPPTKISPRIACLAAIVQVVSRKVTGKAGKGPGKRGRTGGGQQAPPGMEIDADQIKSNFNSITREAKRIKMSRTLVLRWIFDRTGDGAT